MPRSRKSRVLIIEDDSDIASLIADAIAEAGHEVVGIAPNAVSGLVLAEAARPDLAIVDVELSGEISGISAARELAERHDMRIVFATGHAENVFLESQDVDYDLIIKPFSTRELLGAVEGEAPYHHAH